MQITDFRIGEKYDLFLQVLSSDVRTDSRGNPFLVLELTDGSGSIFVRMFHYDGRTVPLPEAGQIVKVRLNCNEFNSKPQLILEKVRPVNDSDVFDRSRFEKAASAPAEAPAAKPAPETGSSKQLLAELQRNDTYEGYLLVRSAEQRANAGGKNYLDMTLCDKSGSINGKMWDGTVQPPLAGSVVYVKATGNEFNGRIQLRVTAMKSVADLSSVDMNTLIPCAPENPQDMMEEIRRTAENLADADLRKITCFMLDKAGNALLTFPAAKQMHHAERGGLLHHMTSMLRGANAMLAVYPFLNRSLLQAGVIIHDLAKIDEMDTDPLGLISDYSVDGKLIGHIVRGVVNIEDAARETGANHSKALLLEHMILSHHGIPDYGSPIAPKFPEAEVLHTLDTLDARLYEMSDALGKAIPGGFSEKVWGLDNRQLYRIPDSDLTEG